MLFPWHCFLSGTVLGVLIGVPPCRAKGKRKRAREGEDEALLSRVLVMAKEKLPQANFMRVVVQSDDRLSDHLPNDDLPVFDPAGDDDNNSPDVLMSDYDSPEMLLPYDDDDEPFATDIPPHPEASSSVTGPGPRQ